jgi:hypothetical protein
MEACGLQTGPSVERLLAKFDQAVSERHHAEVVRPGRLLGGRLDIARKAQFESSCWNIGPPVP